MIRQKKMGVVATFSLAVLMFIALPCDSIGADTEFNFKFANFFPPKAKHSKLTEEFVKELALLAP